MDRLVLTVASLFGIRYLTFNGWTLNEDEGECEVFNTEIKVNGRFIKGAIKKSGSSNTMFYGNIDLHIFTSNGGGLTATNLDNIINELIEVRDKVYEGVK